MKIHKKFCFFAMTAFVVFALGGCSTAPQTPRVSGATAASDMPSRLSLEQANDVTIYAVSLVGTPYRYGGNTPDAGFDCSGLIGYVYQTRGGVMLPRTVAKLQDAGWSVPFEKIRSGDLVVFGRGGPATHAGIYVGDGRFVHAPSTGGEVRLDQLNSKYWAAQKMAFRRP